MIQNDNLTIEALFIELEQARQRIAELETLETKRLADQLRANEERFRQVINSISDHIYVTQIAPDGTHINRYISPHAETLTGYALSMFEADWNFWPSRVIYPDDRMIAAAQAERLAQGVDSEVEYRIMRADGQVIWVRDSGRVTYEGESAVVYGVVSDITLRKQAEEKRRHAQKMEAIGQLAGGVAHDFNNLLTVISGQCELLLKDSFHPNDPRRYEINEIKIASERAIILTQQLLTFSRQRPVQFQVINLNDVIDQIKNMLGRLIGENIDLVDNLAPDLPFIKADAGQIEQVLLNLAINARDAMPKGGNLTIATTAIELDSATAKSMELIGGHYVRLTVADSGTGIQPEVQSRIFEPFFTTKAMGEGTGLGLSTVYGIVRQLGGQVQVFSQVGQGCTFELYLPVTTEMLRPPTILEPHPLDLIGYETILLVEDEASVRTVTAKFLRKRGYNVKEAASIEEALAVCCHSKAIIDLLISDVIMPTMNGYELAKQLKQCHPMLKVLYISGYPDDVLDEYNITTEGLDLLEKPFSADTLARKVRELLD
ncbi:MAG: response regulator [Anaerolineaceae bacterium]|nr:response regulator [Anaerolineaceae bacterium]MCB9102016.1 response regulator [Anaerolineales bacterium]